MRNKVATDVYYTNRNGEISIEKYQCKSTYKAIPVYHVHGYIKFVNLTDYSEIHNAIKSNIILTESDYHEQFSNPLSFNNYIQIEKFKNNTCIFLGVSFTDPNMRKLLDDALNLSTEIQNHYWITKNEYGCILNNYYKKLLEFDKSFKYNINDILSQLSGFLEDNHHSCGIKTAIDNFYIWLFQEYASLKVERDKIFGSIKKQKVFDELLTELIDSRSFNVYPHYIGEYDSNCYDEALNYIVTSLDNDM